MAKPLPKTVLKLESVKGSGMARPSSALALKGAKRNQSKGSAKAAPISAARVEKAMRPKSAGNFMASSSRPRRFLLATDAEIDQREGKVDQHHDDADGGALAELEVLEGHAVIVDGDQFRPVARPAIGEQKRREGVEGPHGDEDEIGDDVAADQRHGDVAEFLPGGRAGHVRRLEIGGRNGGKGRIE